MPFRTERPAEYPRQSQGAKSLQKKKKLGQKPDYQKMLSEAQKTAKGIVPFKSKIFQASLRLGGEGKSFFMRGNPRRRAKQAKEKRRESPGGRRDILDRIDIPQAKLTQVERKLREMCQSLKVLRPDEIKNEYSGLKLVLQVKNLIEGQRRAEGAGSSGARGGKVLSPRGLLQKMHSIMAKSTKPQKKLCRKKLKPFRKNFLKLFLFVKEMGLEDVDLKKMMPILPYSEPQAKEVQANCSSSSRRSWGTSSSCSCCCGETSTWFTRTTS